MLLVLGTSCPRAGCHVVHHVEQPQLAYALRRWTIAAIAKRTNREIVTATGTCDVMVVEVVVAPAETRRGPHDLVGATTLESLDCRQPGMLE